MRDVLVIFGFFIFLGIALELGCVMGQQNERDQWTGPFHYQIHNNIVYNVSIDTAATDSLNKQTWRHHE
jgi:hypothetical protein